MKRILIHAPDGHRHGGTSRGGDDVGQNIVFFTLQGKCTRKTNDGSFGRGILRKRAVRVRKWYPIPKGPSPTLA